MDSESAASGTEANTTSIPLHGDATKHAAEATQEISKNAQKKAAKQEKLAADKAAKAKGEKPIGKSEAKQPTSKPAKKKIEGAALIGIDVSKEEDFPGWYQQVLTKGDMLDYYDISGCYILKVSSPKSSELLLTNNLSSRHHSSFGRRYNSGSISA